MAEEKKKKQKLPKQEWKPNFLLQVLYRAWRVVFAGAKIAAGAAATVLIILVICGFVFAGTLGDYLQEEILPQSDMDMEGYEGEQNSNMYYIDENGNIQIYQSIFAVTRSSWADYEDIPQDLIHAAIAIEDHRFYEHQGVDWITTIKACARMFFGDASVGGSSITQQLIKNVLLTEDDTADDVTVQRKVREIFRAVQLEKRYDKKTILEMYLNFIYLGQGCKGVRSAAAVYYGKEVENLTTAECASIISITNAPTYYDPYQNFENNMKRKDNVLWAMREYGWLTDEEYEEAVSQELVLKNGIAPGDRMAQCTNEACAYKGIVSTLRQDGDTYYCPVCGTEIPVLQNASQGNYSWFADTVLEDVAKAIAEQNDMPWNIDTRNFCMNQIQTGGYHIYTTLDMRVQNQVDAIYTDLSNIPKPRSGQQLQSAMVVIDNSTGDIVAMAGGVGKKTGFDEWNRATDAKLQSGSSIKPISIYAPGFETGAITPATVIKDLPLTYEGGMFPRNDDYVFRYSATIADGVRRSVNAVAAHTLNTISLNTGYDYAKNKFGLSTLEDGFTNSNGYTYTDVAFAPLAMGAQTWGVKVVDMAAAYATFASHGVHREARTFTKVYDRHGNVIIDNTQDSQQVLNQKTLDYMNYCLVNATRNGTGYQAYFSGTQVGGKTGSTSDFKDRWYCGFTGYYTAAVWCGFDTPEPIRGISGNPAAMLCRKVMQPLHSGKRYVGLYDSSVFRTVTVCLDSGKRATDACKADVRVDLKRYADSVVYPEDFPKDYCDQHVMMEFCSVSGCVANEWCKLYAEAEVEAEVEVEEPLVEITEKALLKLTESQVEEIKKAAKHRLDKAYLEDSYVYYTDDEGEDAVWEGFYDKLKQKIEAPYMVCQEHTEESWLEYLESITPTETDPPEDPSDTADPTDPGETTQPTEPTSTPAPTDPTTTPPEVTDPSKESDD